MNDYMAAYHDAVLFIGEVIRTNMGKNHTAGNQTDNINANLFRGRSFEGKEERERESGPTWKT